MLSDSEVGLIGGRRVGRLTLRHPQLPAMQLSKSRAAGANLNVRGDLRAA
jgi:hypothetical protein